MPDTDIALGATDQTAPSAPGALTVDPMDGGAGVSWGAASDDTGVTAYHVYRWVDAPTGAGYTPLPEKVATVTSGTSYTDSGLTNGTTYHYLVRAVDAATNVRTAVGRRRCDADVRPAAHPSGLGRDRQVGRQGDADGRADRRRRPVRGGPAGQPRVVI